MARNDWVALVTDPGAEYTAWVELTRVGLRPYLPQGRRRWHPPHSTTSLLRRYPLFPRYILLPIGDVKLPALRLCRGLRKLRPILSDAEGRPWRAPDAVIAAVRESEDRGDFDEILHKGDPVKLTQGVLAGVQAVLNETAKKGRVEVLLALFGGVRASIPQANIARV
jgi:hypothetical protein